MLFHYNNSVYHKHIFLNIIMDSNTCFGTNYIPWTLHTGTCISRLLQQAGGPISFCGSTQEHTLATTNSGKLQERFWKRKKYRWMDREGLVQGRNPRQLVKHAWL